MVFNDWKTQWTRQSTDASWGIHRLTDGFNTHQMKTSIPCASAKITLCMCCLCVCVWAVKTIANQEFLYAGWSDNGLVYLNPNTF